MSSRNFSKHLHQTPGSALWQLKVELYFEMQLCYQYLLIATVHLGQLITSNCIMVHVCASLRKFIILSIQIFSKDDNACVHLLLRIFHNWVQSPRLFWARIMLKWANKYLGIQRLQSRSVYGDSNSFSMVVLGKKMNCQKVAPFLWNLPTFKKRTHQFWDSKVSGAFPGGLWAKVLLSKCLLQ